MMKHVLASRWWARAAVAAGLFSACAGAAEPQGSCACSQYTATRARPAWVDREIASGEEYQSQGIAECTGIKSMDYADAEKRARDNLSRVINVQVKSTVVSVLKDDGMGGGASRFGQISSEHVSGALLKNSEIFSHWVDVGACAVYAGVRVGKADIDRAMREAEEAVKRKMVNQQWRVAAEGPYADMVLAQLGQALSSLGVVLRSGEGGAEFLVSAAVGEVSLHNENQIARISLRLEARAGTRVLWNRLVQGKGVSFVSEPEPVLVKKAVQDALGNAREELEKFMQESVKQ